MLAAETITTAAIAAGALVVGGLLTLIGTVVAARTKVAELEIAHRQRRVDAHFEAARRYTDDIYIPLNALLSTLADAFLVLRETTDAAGNPREPLDAFRAASHAFRRSTRAITRDGRDAFLTTDLDARLRDFTAFLRASETATDVHAKVVIQTLSWMGLGEGAYRTEHTATGRVLRVIYNETVVPWRVVTIYFDRTMRNRL